MCVYSRFAPLVYRDLHNKWLFFQAGVVRFNIVQRNYRQGRAMVEGQTGREKNGRTGKKKEEIKKEADEMQVRGDEQERTGDDRSISASLQLSPGFCPGTVSG